MGGKAIPKPGSGIGGRKFLEVSQKYNGALKRERAANIISRTIENTSHGEHGF